MLAPGCRGLAQRLHTGMSSATPAGVTAPTAGAGWSPRGLAPVLKRDVVELGIPHARLQRRRAQLPLYACCDRLRFDARAPARDEQRERRSRLPLLDSKRQTALILVDDMSSRHTTAASTLATSATRDNCAIC